MNLWLFSAGVATLALALIHVVAGGREVHQPMLASAASGHHKLIWSVVWHAATVVMLLGGAAFIAAAFMHDRAFVIVAFPLAVFAVMATLFIFYSFVRFRTLHVTPHWIAFTVITGLGLAGLLT